MNDIFSLAGKNIMITGASGHIGRKLSEYCLKSGANLILVDINETSLISDTSQAYSKQCDYYYCDLEQADDLNQLIRKIQKKYICIDGIVNLAAFVGTSDLDGWCVPFEDQSFETWNRCIAVNLSAPFLIVQQLLPQLNQSESASIVNISSIYGQVGPDLSLYDGTGMGNPAAYAASKAGLAQFSRWLSTVTDQHIRVNTVTPGGVYRGQDETFVEKYVKKVPAGRMASEQDMLGIIILLLSDAGSYINGQDINVDGGFTAW